jgi:hypothetical protein
MNYSWYSYEPFHAYFPLPKLYQKHPNRARTHICTVMGINSRSFLQEESNKTANNSSEARSNTGSSSSRDGGRHRSSRGADNTCLAGICCSSGRTITSQGTVSYSWLHGGLVAGASRVWCERAGGVDANALELRTLSRNDSHWRLASDIEETVEGGSDNSKILLGDTEGHGREGDLVNEVGDLGI